MRWREMGLFFSHYSLVLTLSVPRPLGSVTVKGGLEFLCRETHRGTDRAKEMVARPPSAVERTGLSWMMHQTCQRASIRHNGPQGLTGNDSALCWQLIFWREAMRARAITLLPQPTSTLSLPLPPEHGYHATTKTGCGYGEPQQGIAAPKLHPRPSKTSSLWPVQEPIVEMVQRLSTSASDPSIRSDTLGLPDGLPSTEGQMGQ